jgi:hypothetical protein
MYLSNEKAYTNPRRFDDEDDDDARETDARAG